jgi:nucleoside-diphosphate-sugar epimerase
VRVLVTGVAGFIGSHVAEALIARGDHVRGVDCFLDYYPRAVKERNLAGLRRAERFEFREEDLVTADAAALVDGMDAVIHLAAQAGVRASWGRDFRIYCDVNVLGTQRLLEAAAPRRLRFVYSSSSSIYGDAPDFPTVESTLPRPISPYGVSKLAGEHLCRLYTQSTGTPTVSLRYFTVYGPRQRPDMAAHQFIEAALDSRPIRLFGAGAKVRDFTYVEDVVDANLQVAFGDVEPGTVFNVSGGSSSTILQLVKLIGAVIGDPLVIEWLPDAAGDVAVTSASSERLRAATGWRPRVGLDEGIRRQVAWHRRMRNTSHRAELRMV